MNTQTKRAITMNLTLLNKVNYGVIERLHKSEGGTCLSFYLPTFVKGADTRGNPIILKNLLKIANNVLLERGWECEDIRVFLSPATLLLDNYIFWQHQNNGLALFLSEREFTAIHLLEAPPENCFTGSRFHLKPLLHNLSLNVPFYLLSLSHKGCMLYRCDAYGFHRVYENSLPGSMEDTIKRHHPEKTLQGRFQGSSDKQAAFYGHGSTKNDKDQELQLYIKRVEDEVSDVLNRGSAPLVLAGNSQYQAHYRKYNLYPKLLDRGIIIEVQKDNIRELWTLAKEDIIAHEINKQIKHDTESIQYALAKEKGTNTIESAVCYAAQGRVECCIVSCDEEVMGCYDPVKPEVKRCDKTCPESIDLIDFIAIETLFQKGRVWVISPEHIPGDDLIALSLRY